jgi:tRNA pseudouridine38-40 synthase
MPRYRLLIEYDGTPFAGWQQQTDCQSVQGALQDAIAKFSGERVSIRGAGRTDAGVHALGQTAHFDLLKDWDPYRIQAAINFHLKPQPIAVLDCSVTHPNFDARFSATKRHYIYRILCRRAPPVLERNRVWWVNQALDSDQMGAAARVFSGHHDFTTFRAAQCQARSPFKTIDAMSVTRDKSEIRVEVSARSFLHNQVRSMVGSLKLVGDGKWTVGELASALAARDRTRCGPVAPASGLYLAQVEYGDAAKADEATDDG